MQKGMIKSAFLSSLLMLGSCMPGQAAADFNSHFSAGETAFAARNFTAAAENFAQALKYVPEDLRSRFRYGQALFSLNRYSESHNQFQAVLQNSPSNIIARVYLAENLVRLNRPTEARTHLEWILRVQPEHARAQQLLQEIGMAPVNNAAVKAVPRNKQITAAPAKAKHQKQPIQTARAAQASPQNLQSLPVAPKNQSVTAKAVVPVKKAAAVAPAGVAAPQVQQFAPQAFVDGRMVNVQKPVAAARQAPLPANADVAAFDLESYLVLAKDSLQVNLEQARYHLESDDTRAAAVSLMKAEELARAAKDSRRFLEVQILNSLVLVYNRDFPGFGQHLMQLKSVLSPESYKSFLDIYNQGAALKDPVDQARLVAGIAMGAGHHAVATRLLREAFTKFPNDALIGSMLADAQMQNLDYKGAEATLSQLARSDANNGEVWFNLARFYLTADYRPEQVRTYANHAAKLRPDDARNGILLALLDYSEGRIKEGVARIRSLLPAVNDPALKGICERIITDGETAGHEKINFVSVLALPGARHAHQSSFRMLGEDYLKQGSFFTAMKHFRKAGDNAEIGRTWLGLSSALHTAGESAMAATTAGYGLKALHHELAANPGNGRANLYIALYHYERGDKVAARQAIERGLGSQNCERSTRTRLTAILNAISS
jgi:tetratricopeptide (TPR) repeat protein